MFKRTPAPDEVEVLGVQPQIFGDIYHWLIRSPWPAMLLVVTAIYFAVNLVFGGAYLAVGGIDGVGSFADAFYFSVETSGTIGYGAMHPISRAAHALVTLESLVSILLVAVTTGLVFAKFSLPRGRVRFAAHPVLSPYDGVPTLQFRVGNQRAARLIEATIRIVAIRTERTREGVTMYRMYDLLLERERSPALTRSWMVLHKIVPGSPLAGHTPESLRACELELILTITGIDEISGQTMHGQRSYPNEQLRWGMRYADLLSEREDGGLRMDLARFDEMVPTAATAEFPYGEAMPPA